MRLAFSFHFPATQHTNAKFVRFPATHHQYLMACMHAPWPERMVLSVPEMSAHSRSTKNSWPSLLHTRSASRQQGAAGAQRACNKSVARPRSLTPDELDPARRFLLVQAHRRRSKRFGTATLAALVLITTLMQPTDLDETSRSRADVALLRRPGARVRDQRCKDMRCGRILHRRHNTTANGRVDGAVS